jgi:hypothetical protein
LNIDARIVDKANIWSPRLPTSAVDRLVDVCYRCYPDGFIADVQRGDVPARYQTLAAYLAKSVVTPPISVRRIDRYDGHRVVLMKWTRPAR